MGTKVTDSIQKKGKGACASCTKIVSDFRDFLLRGNVVRRNEPQQMWVTIIPCINSRYSFRSSILDGIYAFTVLKP
jgi:hypothetical protein